MLAQQNFGNFGDFSLALSAKHPQIRKHARAEIARTDKGYSANFGSSRYLLASKLHIIILAFIILKMRKSG